MIERRDNISFWERVLTATIITLLLVGYQRMFPTVRILPSLLLGSELEEQLPESEDW